MAKLSVNIEDRNKLRALGLDDITLESIERALAVSYTHLTLPTNSLV